MGALSYEEWLAQVPESIKGDPLWSFQVYPKALLLSDLMWEDTDRMVKDSRGREIAKQLIRSVGSICANIEEGHGRGFGSAGGFGIGARIAWMVLPWSVFSRVLMYSITASRCSTR